jgi:hypothetical protein
MGNLNAGDRVFVTGPKDTPWVQEEGTVIGFEKDDPEWVAVDLDDDGRQLLRAEHLEKLD